MGCNCSEGTMRRKGIKVLMVYSGTRLYKTSCVGEIGNIELSTSIAK